MWWLLLLSRRYWFVFTNYLTIFGIIGVSVLRRHSQSSKGQVRSFQIQKARAWLVTVHRTMNYVASIIRLFQNYFIIKGIILRKAWLDLSSVLISMIEVLLFLIKYKVLSILLIIYFFKKIDLLHRLILTEARHINLVWYNYHL